LTTTSLLADLRRRDVVLRADGNRLRVDAPVAVLAAADRAALTAHKAALLVLLRAEEATRPATPCGLCGITDWWWQPDWPRPGARRWLCRACISQPAPSLESVTTALAPEDHRRLRIEAANGDKLAALVLRAIEGTCREPGEEG
jgi:hypothetical protein